MNKIALILTAVTAEPVSDPGRLPAIVDRLLASGKDTVQAALSHPEAKKKLVGLTFDATVLAPADQSQKAAAFDKIMAELKEMGFGEDNPINGGDCVEQVAIMYELNKHLA